MKPCLALPLVTLIAALSVTGCTSKSEDIERAKGAVSAGLADPSSVQYRNIEAYGDGVVCGEFNAKNKFGGYVGFRQFTYGKNLWEFDMEPTTGHLKALCTNAPDRRKTFLTQKLELLERGCAQTAPMPGTPCAEVWNARQELNSLIYKQ